MDKYRVRSAYRRLKKQNDGIKEKAIVAAKLEIDSLIEKAVLDDSFYENYYNIKRLIQVHNTISPGLLTGLYTGMIITVSFKFLDNNNIVGYVLFLLVSVIISYFASIRCLASVPNCILYPHMLKRMEEKLEKEEQNTRQTLEVKMKQPRRRSNESAKQNRT